MDQGGEMNELDDRGEDHRPRILGARGPAREQQQGGPKQLPFHVQKVLVHLGDDREIPRDNPPQLLAHPLELTRDRALEIA